MVLVLPPLAIYVGVMTVWIWAFSLCVDELGVCLGSVQSEALYEAQLPLQLVGLFLGAVTIQLPSQKSL